MNYKIKDIGDFKLINKDTEETLIEGQLFNDDGVNVIHKIKENLIPLTIKIDEFELSVFITKETYQKLQNYNEKINIERKS